MKMFKVDDVRERKGASEGKTCRSMVHCILSQGHPNTTQSYCFPLKAVLVTSVLAVSPYFFKSNGTIHPHLDLSLKQTQEDIFEVGDQGGVQREESDVRQALALWARPSAEHCPSCALFSLTLDTS